MRYNRNFAKSEDGEILVFAPSEFDYGGIHYNATNSEKIYNGMGYLCYVRTEMPVKEGCYYTPYYETEGGRLVQKWKDNKFSKEAQEKNE